MIELPWMPRELSPNHRSRTYHAKASATKKARGWAKLATMAAGVQDVPEGHIRLLLTFYPPTAHERDRDNLLASCKAYLDGIADALGVNDARFDPTVQIGETVKHGRVVVTIDPPEARSIGEIIAPIMADIAKRVERAA